MKATIQNELCLTDEWEADLLKVVSSATKLGMHCSVNESVTEKKFSLALLSDTIYFPQSQRERIKSCNFTAELQKEKIHSPANAIAVLFLLSIYVH